MPKPRIAAVPARRYRGDAVPMRAIRKFAREVAEHFDPEKIILFGSYAYGTPDEDSDVDILVVMETKKGLDQAGYIRLAVPRRFPMDLIVRRPKEIRRGLEEEDWFLREIMAKGKILYEKAIGAVGAKGRRRLGNGPPRRRKKATR